MEFTYFLILILIIIAICIAALLYKPSWIKFGGIGPAAVPDYSEFNNVFTPDVLEKIKRDNLGGIFDINIDNNRFKLKIVPEYVKKLYEVAKNEQLEKLPGKAKLSDEAVKNLSNKESINYGAVVRAYDVLDHESSKIDEDLRNPKVEKRINFIMHKINNVETELKTARNGYTWESEVKKRDNSKEVFDRIKDSLSLVKISDYTKFIYVVPKLDGNDGLTFYKLLTDKGSFDKVEADKKKREAEEKKNPITDHVKIAAAKAIADAKAEEAAKEAAKEAEQRFIDAGLQTIKLIPYINEYNKKVSKYLDDKIKVIRDHLIKEKRDEYKKYSNDPIKKGLFFDNLIKEVSTKLSDINYIQIPDAHVYDESIKSLASTKEEFHNKKKAEINDLVNFYGLTESDKQLLITNADDKFRHMKTKEYFYDPKHDLEMNRLRAIYFKKGCSMCSSMVNLIQMDNSNEESLRKLLFIVTNKGHKANTLVEDCLNKNKREGFNYQPRHKFCDHMGLEIKWSDVLAERTEGGYNVPMDIPDSLKPPGSTPPSGTPGSSGTPKDPPPPPGAPGAPKGPPPPPGSSGAPKGPPPPPTGPGFGKGASPKLAKASAKAAVPGTPGGEIDDDDDGGITVMSPLEKQLLTKNEDNSDRLINYMYDRWNESTGYKQPENISKKEKLKKLQNFLTSEGIETNDEDDQVKNFIKRYLEYKKQPGYTILIDIDNINKI